MIRISVISAEYVAAKQAAAKKCWDEYAQPKHKVELPVLSVAAVDETAGLKDLTTAFPQAVQTTQHRPE